LRDRREVDQDQRKMENRSLYQILADSRSRNNLALIVDLKMRSPRAGTLIDESRLEPYVESLLDAGVDALSMPTDRVYFGGSLELARRVRRLCDLPLMRKEFFSDVHQIDESREAGFDAVQLSLGTIPDPALFAALRQRAERLGLEVIVGAYGRAQLDRAIMVGARAIGINNRDITALELDGGTVDASASLLPLVPDDMLVLSESGLLTAEDVWRAGRAGADGVLIGTAVARNPDPVGWLRSLRGALVCHQRTA
jgi:indole-3-glycerol phosphate synthase